MPPRKKTGEPKYVWDENQTRTLLGFALDSWHIAKEEKKWDKITELFVKEIGKNVEKATLRSKVSLLNSFT